MTRKSTNQIHSRIFTSSPSLSHSNVWLLLHRSTTECCSWLHRLELLKQHKRKMAIRGIN